MKKRIALFSILILCAGFFTGCGNTPAILDSEDGVNMVAQYAAGILIERTDSYALKYPDKDKKVTPETEEETTAPPETESTETTPTDETIPEGETVPEEETETQSEEEVFNLASILGLGENVSISYTGYDVCAEYDVNDFFSFEAEEGCKFLVLKFNLANNSGETVTVNTEEKNIIFKIQIDYGEPEERQVNNYSNLALNDITGLKNVEIEAGGTMEGVVVFMLEDKIIDNAVHMTFIHKEDEGYKSMSIL